MEKAYAQAIHSALMKGADEAELVASLKKHLAEAGRLKLLPAIARELRTLNARTRTMGASLEVATEALKEEALKEAKELGIESPAVFVNPDLVSGWRLRESGRLIDRSGKRALIDIYRRITS